MVSDLTQPVRPDPATLIEAIQMIAKPSDVTSIQQFLGLVGYYRRFIKDYAQIAAPLHSLTRKNVRVASEWSDAHDAAFTTLRSAAISPHV